MTPKGATSLKGKGKQSKRLKLLLLAVVGFAAFIYMRRGSAPASTADTGAPITTDPTAGLAPGADTAAVAGTLSGDPALTDLQQQLAQLASRTNDQFGHYADLEEAYGQLKAGNDPFGAITGTDSGGDPGTTGAGDPTGADSTPVAMPGNAKAAAGATNNATRGHSLVKRLGGGAGAPPRATLPPRSKGTPRFVPARGGQRAHWAYPGGGWAPAPKKAKKPAKAKRPAAGSGGAGRPTVAIRRVVSPGGSRLVKAF